jgi:hypothetical protein
MRWPPVYPKGDKRFCNLLHNKTIGIEPTFNNLLITKQGGFHLDFTMTFLLPPEPIVHD